MSFFDVINFLYEVGDELEINSPAFDLSVNLQQLFAVIDSDWLTGDCNLSLDNPLVCFDIGSLRGGSEKKIYSVIFLLVRIFHDLSLQNEKELKATGEASRKHIVIDEAWALFKYPPVARFIHILARIAPQFNASLIVTTQDVTDLIQLPAAEKMLEQASFIVSLGYQSEGLKQQNVISLDEAAIEAARCSTTENYSQFVCIDQVQGTHETYYLELDAFSKVLFGSSPSDQEKLQSLIDSGATKQDAIALLATEGEKE